MNSGIQYHVHMTIKPQTVFIAAVALIVGVVCGVVIVETYQKSLPQRTQREEGYTKSGNSVVVGSQASNDATADYTEETGIEFPLIERLSTSTYLLITTSKERERGVLGTGPLAMFSFNANTLESNVVDSFAQSQGAWEITTSTWDNIEQVHFGFYGPGNIDDYYSKTDGSLLLSVSNSWDRELDIKRDGKTVHVALDYTCPSYDELQPNTGVATGAIFGIIVNGKKKPLAQPFAFSCDLLGGADGYVGPSLLPHGYGHDRKMQESLLFTLPSRDQVVVSISKQHFGEVEIQKDAP